MLWKCELAFTPVLLLPVSYEETRDASNCLVMCDMKNDVASFVWKKPLYANEWFSSCCLLQTVNTASRMESNGVKGKIHVSQAKADQLTQAGKGRWLTAREDKITAEGKGKMQTYFVSPASAARTYVSNAPYANSTNNSSAASLGDDSDVNLVPIEELREENAGPTELEVWVGYREPKMSSTKQQFLKPPKKCMTMCYKTCIPLVVFELPSFVCLCSSSFSGDCWRWKVIVSCWFPWSLDGSGVEGTVTGYLDFALATLCALLHVWII
mgnify:CR=1 FL=1